MHVPDRKTGRGQSILGSRKGIGEFSAVLGALCLTLAFFCQAGRAAEADRLPKGPAIIVLAPEQPPREDLESEAYFDWAAILDDFLISKPQALGLARMSIEQWRRFDDAVGEDGYGTVFLRADGSALFYHGMILDLPIYRAGAEWATRANAAAPEGFGLNPSAPRASERSR